MKIWMTLMLLTISVLANANMPGATCTNSDGQQCSAGTEGCVCDH